VIRVSEKNKTNPILNYQTKQISMTTPDKLEQKQNAIETKKSESVEKKSDLIPPQYKGMPSEFVEEFWEDPVYIDAEKNKSAIERRRLAIDAIKQAEADREIAKQEHLSQKYAGLSDEQKSNFPAAQLDASSILHKYIQGERELDALSTEESFVIGKLRIAYDDFKKENPDKPFHFSLARDIDKSVYNNLAQKLAFETLMEKQPIIDSDKTNAIREKMGIPKQENELPIEKTGVKKPKTETLSLAERKKLSGWSASYELAKIAETQGVDLLKLSREEYAEFAIDNSLTIDDDQLRLASWHRTATSIEQVLLERKKRKAEIEGSDEDKAFVRFENETKAKAGEQDRRIGENIRVRSGTKDSSSWLFFGINAGLEENPKETYKSYISVRDIKTLTPERFKSFMQELQKNGYNGDVKIFQDLAAQGVTLNDQVVMHGRSKADSELAFQVAEKFFGNDLDQKNFGKDEVIDGKNTSYSQILANKIKNEISNK
jgi:hypothetical protein